MTDALCSSKHTKYQPSDDEWKCPKCGAGNEHFYIDESEEGSSDECAKLHRADLCYCTACNCSITGNAFAKRIEKLKNLITCSHCAGTGLVTK